MLAGGAARGAYEVGVVQHVLYEVVEVAEARHQVRHPVRNERRRAQRVRPRGLGARGTRVGQSHARRLAAPRSLVARRRPTCAASCRPFAFGRTDFPLREGGILDPTGIEQVVKDAIPFERIDDNIASGLRPRGDGLDDARAERPHDRLRADPATAGCRRGARTRRSIRAPTKIRAHHALASAAIPILFRSVRIDGEFHCDGGLRQNVPLSPARRLGADAVLVINPRFVTDDALAPQDPKKEEAFPGPLFLLGKTLNALLLDRIDTDLARLESVNKILDAGVRAYGPDFVAKLNAALGHRAGHGLRPMRAMLIRSSRDIGGLATEFVRASRGRSHRPHGAPHQAARGVERRSQRVRPALVRALRRPLREDPHRPRPRGRRVTSRGALRVLPRARLIQPPSGASASTSFGISASLTPHKATRTAFFCGTTKTPISRMRAASFGPSSQNTVTKKPPS